MKRVLAGLFAVLSLAFVLGACSKSKQLEDKIADSVKSETNLKDVKVTCPGNVKATKGEQVTCTATGDFTSYLRSAASSAGTSIGDAQITSVKINVTFTSDNTFSADVDSSDLQGQIAAQLGSVPSTDLSTDSGASDTLPDGGEN